MYPKTHQKRYPVYTLYSSVSRIEKMFSNLPFNSELAMFFSARNFGIQTEAKRRQLVRIWTNKTKKNLKHQIIGNCPFRYAIEWIMTKNPMISEMIKGHIKDMQLQIFCEWLQPSSFTRKVPVKIQKKTDIIIDICLEKIIPKFHSCFFQVPPFNQKIHLFHQPTGYPYFTPYRTAADRRSSAASTMTIQV